MSTVEDEFKVCEIINMKDLKVKYIQWVMKKMNMNKVSAAKAINISVRTVYNLVPEKKDDQ